MNKSREFNKLLYRLLTSLSENDVSYHVAWSNQCIEYWFILHFNYYTSDNDRKFYIDNLNNNFIKVGLPPYKKNDKNIFSNLTDYGDPKLAIRYAKRRIDECKDYTDSDSVPATKVYELVEELSKYLPNDIKNKYI